MKVPVTNFRLLSFRLKTNDLCVYIIETNNFYQSGGCAMKRVTLNIQDSLYDPIISLLKHLGKDKVEIVSSEKISNLNEVSLNSRIKSVLAKTDIKTFKNIKDPVKWQREQRDEW